MNATLVTLVDGRVVLSDAEQVLVRYALSLTAQERHWYFLSIEQTDGAKVAQALREAVERREEAQAGFAHG